MDPKAQLLQQLQDIHAPEAAGWWPLAPGWWILIGITALIITWLFWRLYRNRQNNLYRRQALILLKKIERNPDEHAVENIFALLKRTALTTYGHSRNYVAPLYGEHFVNFLNKSAKDSTIKLNRDWANAIYSASKNSSLSDIRPLIKFANEWIKRHKIISREDLDSIYLNSPEKEARLAYV